MKSVCGLDVHKDSVYLCILSEFGELVEKVFGVLTYQFEDHSRKCISPQDNHRVCMGSQQDEGLLLQPVLIPSDASKEKEQDEGPGGCGKKDAHRRLACVA